MRSVPIFCVNVTIGTMLKIDANADDAKCERTLSEPITLPVVYLERGAAL